VFALTLYAATIVMHVQIQWQFRMLGFVHDKKTTRCIIFNTHYIVQIPCGYMVDDPG